MVWWRKRQRATENAGEADGTGPEAKRARPSAEEEKELHDVQLELQLLEQKCAEEQITVQQRYDRLRQPFFERRSALLRCIPGFWRAALRSHPQQLVHPAEEEVLGQLLDLSVKDNLDRRGSYEVHATFGENSIFLERSICKRVTFQDTFRDDVSPATLTPAGDSGKDVLDELRTSSRRSVLGWFMSSASSGGGLNSPDSAGFGDVLRGDLWQDPIPYYVAHCGSSSTTGAQTDALGDCSGSLGS
eukprot:TRINITY_DN23746_c0_g1_i2.p1 TRINITY_DN23746_c0_g1~~TRINITY_DN23746_c0_g1_i2.p1  ORF type:complete len:263 (+),score=60.81 TRINITY_DN23746_c0_g1_i2:57-791(+)